MLENIFMIFMVYLVVFGFMSIIITNEKSFWEISKTHYFVKSEWANIRERPSTEDKIITTLKQGEPLNVIFSGEGWFEVEFSENKNRGFIHKSLVVKYLMLGYYKKVELGKSLFEVEMDW